MVHISMGCQPNHLQFYHKLIIVVPVAKLNIKLQVAPIIPHPHVKRKAIANPRALSGQWRKISPQPAISDSIPQQRQSIPASPAPINIPPAPLRVKWKDMICKKWLCLHQTNTKGLNNCVPYNIGLKTYFIYRRLNNSVCI
ncbi:uncharacterized protein LOC131015916 isoform X3 [Salvia miltiorrhiza]|uniref:uncharacterized protein LOC131015916 isoform X3 n=1 Tax=Salvia miltiorrhiza TaxID=226208 RepID=UPI0025AD2895|nr:uncharacterized protein LOC131015916 isoform X3 [Salvia miltiorrhiza]